MNIDLPWSSSPRVSVIIPATASLDLLLAALRSLSRHAPRHISMETIVVLNDSVAEHASYLREFVNGVVLIPSEVNLGFAGAANRARRVARGDLLILLHDDAEIEPGWLEALIDAADTHPEAGAIGGKVLFPDGQLQNAGMVLWRDATSSTPWAGQTPPSTAFDEARAVDYCGSSSLLVRSEIWDAIGGLDEQFYPVYYVDTDLAMSVRQLGRVVLYQPASQIRHHRSASTSPRWKEFVSARNRRLFREKWGSVLDQQEPADKLDMPAAILRATARAASFVTTTVPRAATSRALTAVAPAPPDTVYLQKERVLLNAYAAHLVERVDEVEHQLEMAVSATVQAETELAELRAKSVYLLGTPLSFATRGGVYQYQFTGGYGAEDWGLWLGADPFRVLLPIAFDSLVDGSGNQFSVQVDAVPFLGASRLVSPLCVSVNGEKVIEINETRGGRQHYEGLTAPHELRTHNLIVTIEGARAVTPTSLGLQRDDRPLSVGIVGLTIGRQPHR
jgi:GT2 family glycosyltransferase